MSDHTEYHTLTLEWAQYPKPPGEVTAAFCSCDGWSFAISAPAKGVKDIEAVTEEFAGHIVGMSA